MRVRDIHGVEHELDSGIGLTLAQAVYLSGRFPTRALCSGISRCGRCRVRFPADAPLADETERAVLGELAVEQGWRLGCRHKALPGLVIEVPGPGIAQAVHAEQDALAAEDAVMAVDLGTTSIHWSVCRNGARIDSGAMLNPQLGAGSEVMSRLAFAREPRRAGMLRGLVISALEQVMAERRLTPQAMCVAANQAMTCILLGLPVESLSAAPYRLCHGGGDWKKLAPGLPETYILPQLSAFVGGDAVAGIVALKSKVEPPKPPYLLVDMGTNGEFVLALPDGAFLAASVPLGPALEGVALACGVVFGAGAITGYALGPKGLAGEGAADGPAGITGTGYVSLISRLLAAGLVGAHGRFEPKDTPLARMLAKNLGRERGEKRLHLPGGLYLSAGDLEEVLKVKAAFNVAFARLLAEAGLSAGELSAVFVAGALGEHVCLEDLESLGFLPPGMAGKARAVGNTSLAGAELCAQDQKARELAQSLPKATRVIDLVDTQDFGSKFMQAMQFRYVD